MRDIALWFMAFLDQKQAGYILSMKQLYPQKKNCIYEIFHGQLMILNQYCTICLPMRNKYVSGFVGSFTIFSFETKSGLILDIQ